MGNIWCYLEYINTKTINMTELTFTYIISELYNVFVSELDFLYW